MQNVPLFPEFRKFTLADEQWYNQFYKQFEPCGDFSFGNLLVWLDYYEDLVVARHNDNLVFVCTNLFMNSQKVFTFLGREKANETIKAILAYQTSLKQKPTLTWLTEEVIKGLPKNHRYVITEDRDNYDYLYKTEQWAYLEGSLMRKLRREVNTFTKKYGSISTVRDIDLHDHNQIALIRDCFNKWPDAFSDNDPDRDEEKVLDRLFNLCTHKELPYKCIELFVGDSLEAFLIYQFLPQRSIVDFNHIKTSYKYRYAFNFLLHSAAKHLLDSGGIDQINFEQDLGISGLRQHKMFLKPYDFIKKFTIRPR